ncbi:MAG: trk/ktr system potassium uptake protein [Eubacteriales bacterium SKADARSKE-1]|nr:trk/ktr system potassium uptake protein [Eubacteriales bacterium SKADARSKE-1]
MLKEMGDKAPKTIKDVPAVRLIVLSFLLVVLSGASLLYMPFCSKIHEKTKFIDALFTATSATCVTGLAVFDTFTKWTFAGQFVILLLIQLGGLGIITFTTAGTLFLRGKLGFRDLQIASEHTSGRVIDISNLIKTILIWTFTCETIGSILLAIRFVPQFGVQGIWPAIFTAISAYCNAGFDVMGFLAPGTSFMYYSKDALVSITISVLIIFGGLGFIVISDIGSCIYRKFKKIRSHKRLNVHTILVLITTASLIVVGTTLFMLCEQNNTLKDMTFFDKLDVSFFQTTSMRTAGFFSAPIDTQFDITKIMSIFWMFIGASPASTGGGIKTTTLAVIIIAVVGILKGQEDPVVLKHKISKSTIYKALTIVSLSFFLVTILTIMIFFFELDKSFLSILYEVVSAFSTTGLTTGITPFLSTASKALLSLAMFTGRVGPISLILSVTMKQHKRGYEKILPEGKIVVG